MNITFGTGSLPISDDEVAEYIKYVLDKAPHADSIELTAVGDMVDIVYHVPEIKFDRVRRITGYLVGTLDRWNNAKRAEEADRVKHSI